ncbi:hypothetical protein J661_0094 [Acinetobacter baumannii 1391434]|nr:hypothetical protein J661_0094 [Acinetobacter baumannii 1391434]
MIYFRSVFLATCLLCSSIGASVYAAMPSSQDNGSAEVIELFFQQLKSAMLKFYKNF